MAGHSKWLNTKHRKAAKDAKRGKVFTKIISELVSAARCGGGDVAKNPRLRVAIDKALSNNMTRDTLSRAVTRGIGNNSENINKNTITYEGYGPDGIAMIIECLSDNRNRTAAEIRSIFNQSGGNLGVTGSVSYLFKKKGILSFKNKDKNIVKEIVQRVVDVKDIITYDNGNIDVYIIWEKMNKIHEELEMANIKPDKSEISMVPLIKININSETLSKLLDMINILKMNNDVKKIYHNGEISDKISEIF